VDGTRSALIVASYDYQDPGLRRLRAPARDAEALARVLRDPAIGDFDVRTMLNEPAYVVNEAVEEFFDERGPDDLLLLHFSCHGVKDEGGELYFATVNTKLRRLGATAVAADFVNRRMSRSRSRRVVLLLDCCYAGAFERGIVARAGAGVNIEEQFGGRGRAVITASSAMEYAFEGDQLADTQTLQPSVFTSALVEGLETGEADRDQDGYIALDELYDYVYDRVRAVTPNQTPGKWTFAVQGELYIARRSRPVTTPAPLPPELQQVIEHPIPTIRAGAVKELDRLLGSRHAGLALAARLALEDLVDDDSRTVSAAATAALASSPEPVAKPSEHPQTDATEPATSPLSVPPQPPVAASPLTPTGPTTPPEKASASAEDEEHSSIPNSAAPQTSPERTLKPDGIAQRAMPSVGVPTSTSSNHPTIEGVTAPDPREPNPPVGGVGVPPTTFDKPNQTQPPPPGGIQASIGLRRVWVRAFGIITLLNGLLILIWPGRTVLVLAVLSGIQLVVMGIFRLKTAFASGESGTPQTLLVALGVLSLIGPFILPTDSVTAFRLAWVLGIFWIVNGAVEMFMARSHRATRGRGLTTFIGLLSVGAGVVLLVVYPGSLFALAVELGCWLLLLGIMEIVLASRFVAASPRSAGP
jgi:uncharacterized membrane protein HdeD (DUF308 family)